MITKINIQVYQKVNKTKCNHLLIKNEKMYKFTILNVCPGSIDPIQTKSRKSDFFISIDNCRAYNSEKVSFITFSFSFCPKHCPFYYVMRVFPNLISINGRLKVRQGVLC